MGRIRFVKVREVKSPTRANVGDAGMDLYTPTNLTLDQLKESNSEVKDLEIIDYDKIDFKTGNTVVVKVNKKGFIYMITLYPHSRIIIPSGIKTLIEPIDSGLFVHNKSGVSTKKGILYTAEVVDSPYTGEIHLGVLNSSNYKESIKMGDKLLQVVHTPILLTDTEEISIKEYDSLSENWGTRGNNWQGSSDDK